MLPETSRHVRLVLSLGLALTTTAVIALAPCPVEAQPTPTAPAPATLPALTTEVAFPNLKFNRPVALAYPDDASNLLFVAEQHKATIQSFPDEKDTTDKREFLKLPDPINRGNEEGLLGLAFHPRYKQNGEFFVYYSANDTGHAALGRLAVQRLEGRPAQGRPRQ